MCVLEIYLYRTTLETCSSSMCFHRYFAVHERRALFAANMISFERIKHQMSHKQHHFMNKLCAFESKHSETIIIHQYNVIVNLIRDTNIDGE